MAKLLVQKDGVSKSEARTLNFVTGTGVTWTIAETGQHVNIQLDAAGGSGAVATDTIFDAKGDLAAGTGADTAAALTVGANDTILMADSGETTGLKWVASASPSAISTAAATGTSDTFTRGDHVHAHEAAHTAHDTIWDAKGDLVTGSAADTAVKTSVGADDTILMADAAASGGVKWVASASPSAVGTAAVTGTADTFTRGDHVHAHETGHTAHDTIWDAKGDIAAGTAADTSAVLTAGANGTILTAQSGQTTGLQWATLYTRADFASSGTLSTGTGALRWYNDTGRTLTFTKVRASAGTAPASQSILCDVNVDGTTIWSTQGSRVAIAAAANTGTSSTFDTTTIADGHYLTVDIDQVGTGTAGSNLTVQVWMSG